MKRENKKHFYCILVMLAVALMASCVFAGTGCKADKSINPTEEPTASPEITLEPTATPEITAEPTATEAPKATQKAISTQAPAEGDLFVIPSDNETFDIDFAKTLLEINIDYSYGYAEDTLAGYGMSVILSGNDNAGKTDHTARYYVGSTRVEGREVVLIIVGPTSGNEWYSNVDFAPSGDNDTKYAENFYMAAEDIFTKIESCLGSDKTIIVTGYSRGAAVANLLGYKLNEIYGSENIYTYTYATPATIRGDFSGDKNIFNIVNVNDLVTMVPPAYLGYKRLGTDIVLGTVTDITKKIKSVLSDMSSFWPDIYSYYNVKYSLVRSGVNEEGGKTLYEFITEIIDSTSDGASFGQIIAKMTIIRSESAFYPIKELCTLSNITAIGQNHGFDTYSELLDSYK